MPTPRNLEGATYQLWPVDLKTAAQQRAEELGLTLSESTRRLWRAFLDNVDARDVMAEPKGKRGST